jgi:hypothetical protein
MPRVLPPPPPPPPPQYFPFTSPPESAPSLITHYSLPRIYHHHLSINTHAVFRCLSFLETRFANFHGRTAPSFVRHRHGVVGAIMTETLTAGTTVMFPFRRCKYMLATMTLLSSLRKNISIYMSFHNF